MKTARKGKISGRESIRGEGRPRNEQRVLNPLTRSQFGAVWGGGKLCALKELMGGECGQGMTREPEEVIGVGTYICVCVVGLGSNKSTWPGEAPPALPGEP